MMLFSRTVITNGDMEAVRPIAEDLAGIFKRETDRTMNVWAAVDGCVPGTLTFGVPIESMAARAAVATKLGSNKDWWAASRKLTEHRISSEPDMLYRFIRGGGLGTTIPRGTVISQHRVQLAQGGDWEATLKWANELAELCKQTTGIETNVAYSIYGRLGDVVMLNGLRDAAALDEHQAKLLANAEYMSKLMANMPNVMAGGFMRRSMTKIA